MNHGVVANTLPKALRDLLIEHIDGTSFVEGTAALRVKSLKLISIGLIELSTGRDARSTSITADGRQVLACVLARYAELLKRAGYDGLESPNTKRAAQAAAEIDWRPEEWRVSTRYGSAVLRGKTQAAIFDVLWRKREVRGLTMKRIADVIYADDPEGGTVDNSVAEAVRRMRRALAPARVEIRGGTTGGNGYSLVVASELVVSS